MRPLTANFAPFIDNGIGQNISFVNLPIDDSVAVHRGITSAASIPPQQLGPQTALVGSSYSGANTFAVSPDTPAKSPPDDTSYSAPGGGVLASVTLQVLAGQAGQPSLYIDLDDSAPNAPGSGVVFFDGSGTTTIDLAESSLGDGFHGEGATCQAVLPRVDSDADGFTDTVEEPVGTDPLMPCGVDSWPPDINNDGFVDVIGDISRVTGVFGQSVPPASARYDIAPDPPDGFIDVIRDISKMAGLFGEACPSSELLSQAPGATTSRYVSDLTNDCNADYDTMFAYGQTQALAGQRGIVVLDFGAQQNVGGVWGTIDWHEPAVFHDHAQIFCGVRGFIHGFGTSSFPGQELHIGIGTNNSGPLVDSSAGQAWATLVNDVNTYIDSAGFTNLLATGANDIEPGYSTAVAARDWTNGYDTSAVYRYYDFGSADGCPGTETSIPGEDQPCPTTYNDWDQSDVEWVSWGDPWAWPLPDIYSRDWDMAWQWQKISVYGYYHDLSNGRLRFSGTLTQYQACQQSDPSTPFEERCSTLGLDNPPAEGWRQLQWAVSTDDRTAVIIENSSDIRRDTYP